MDVCLSDRSCAPSSPRAYWLTFLATLSCCVFPLLLTPFPPLTDLPQHVAQVARALGASIPPEQYIAWWAPNNLIYLPMMGLWWMVGPHYLGQATLIFLAFLWVSAHFLMARHAGRSGVAAALASLTLYSGIFYWGMLNFLVAWPCFLLWWIAFDRLRESRPWTIGRYVLTVGCGFLLVWAHVLMLGMAGIAAVCTGVNDWRSCRPRGAAADSVRRSIVAVSTFLPVAMIALPWVFQLNSERRDAGFFVGAYWTNALLDRVTYLFTEAFGVGSPVPWLFGVALALWILAGIKTAVQDRAVASEAQWNAQLLTTGLVALLVALLLPDKYLNTIQFAVRWLPGAGALMCLAAPGPPIRPWLKNTVVACLMVAFSVSAGTRWWSFHNDDLDGLEAALTRIPSSSRVLGLDFLKESDNFPGARPFLHVSAYATAFKQCSTNFDFGRHGTGLIRGTYTPGKWTPGIEWMAEWARPSDLLSFDYALVGAPAHLHNRFLLAQWMQPITQTGKWRLYEIQR